MTHRSATTLTGEVNNIDHIITVQCSAGKPRVLAFLWKPLDMHNPTKHCSSAPCHGNGTLQWQFIVHCYRGSIPKSGQDPAHQNRITVIQIWGLFWFIRFALGWHLLVAQIWQTEADHPSAIIPCGMWAGWGCHRNSFSIWVATTRCTSSAVLFGCMVGV